MRKNGILIALMLAPAAAFAQPGEPDMAPPMPQQPMPQQPMPGSTHASFVSSSAMQWDVTIGEQPPACATPCSLWIPPLSFVALHSHEPAPVRLDVGYLDGGEVVVRAKPLRQGEYAAGIVFTTFSGMGLATGITLTAVGCSTDHNTMCTAGVITGVASAVALYGSIWLMRDALPQARIGPASPYVTGNQVGLAGRF